MRQTVLALCSRGEKLPRQSELPSAKGQVIRLSKLSRDIEKLVCTETVTRPYTVAKYSGDGSLTCPGVTSYPGFNLINVLRNSGITVN